MRLRPFCAGETTHANKRVQLAKAILLPGTTPNPNVAESKRVSLGNLRGFEDA